MGTVFLFDNDAYLREFSGTVLECKQQDDGSFSIILDQTAFFPEQGGQTSDIGYIQDVEVVHVSIENEQIIHHCKAPLAAGDQVCGRIDWNHRFNNMQQHTGEHIFTGLAHNKFDAENVGFHLSDNVVTLDLNVPLTSEQIAEVEAEANNIIAAAREVVAWYPNKEELQAISYRSKKEIEGAIRLVRVADIDICACCAPHVRNTSEVGILKVVNFEKYKGGVRVYILCGLRALGDYTRRMATLAECTKLFSCGEAELLGNIKKVQEEARLQKQEAAAAKRQLLQLQVKELSKDAKNAIVFTDGVDSKTMREVVNEMVEQFKSGICGIFSGDDEKGYSYILASGQIDMTKVAGSLRTQLNCKGGGSAAMIQGQIFNNKEEIGKVLDGGNY